VSVSFWSTIYDIESYTCARVFAVCYVLFYLTAKLPCDGCNYKTRTVMENECTVFMVSCNFESKNWY
jgi:hypothetical protein